MKSCLKTTIRLTEAAVDYSCQIHSNTENIEKSSGQLGQKDFTGDKCSHSAHTANYLHLTVYTVLVESFTL